MTIDAGILNRRLTIQRYTASAGTWADDYTWTDERTIWAAARFDSADQAFQAGQPYTKRIITFTIHFTRDLFETDRLVYDLDTYEIVGISEVGNRDGLEIKARILDPSQP